MSRPTKARALDPETVMLLRGSHTRPQDGLCVMELAAYLAHETHSDSPTCVAAPLAAFLRAWNDGYTVGGGAP